MLVIAGLLEVTLHGFNLGKTLEDINFIKVNGIPCTSIVHLSSELVKCISYQAGAVGDSITADMIHVSTIGGNTRGIYPEPTSIARSGSGRPILSAVDLDMKTFLPYSIKLVSDYFNGTVLKTLYWTNVGLNSYSIQRSSVDGRNIQTVVNSVSFHLVLNFYWILS